MAKAPMFEVPNERILKIKFYCRKIESKEYLTDSFGRRFAGPALSLNKKLSGQLFESC